MTDVGARALMRALHKKLMKVMHKSGQSVANLIILLSLRAIKRDDVK